MRPINVGWWNELAHAIFGVQGDDPVPEVGGHVQVVADLSRLRPEWFYPAGVIPFVSTQLSQIAVAAQFSSVFLHNAVDSGLLVVVTGIQHDGLNAVNVFCRLRDATVLAGEGGAVATVQQLRDTRFLRADNTTGLLPMGPIVRQRANAAAATPAPNTILFEDSDVSLWSKLDPQHWYVLGPNGVVGLEMTVVNQAVGPVVFFGYVVTLHKGKRA